MLTYVGAVNPNLICCICRTPFTQPTVSRVCSHTFCLDCIAQSIAANPQCPVDRSSLLPDDLIAANPIIRHLVDELLVYCPHKDKGCPSTCERQLLPGHIREDCLYSLMVCPDGCGEHFLRKDELVHRCGLSSSPNSPKEGADNIDLTSQQRHRELDSCPLDNALCIQADNGCGWTGLPSQLSSHLMDCPYEAIKGFFDIERRRTSVVKAENDMLRDQIEKLQRTLLVINRDLTLAKEAMGPWFVPHPVLTESLGSTTSYHGEFEEQSGPVNDSAPSRNVPAGSDFYPNSTPNHPYSEARSQIPSSDFYVPFRPAFPQPLDPTKSIYRNLRDLQTTIIALSSNLASLARHQTQSLNTEVLRLNDEMASLRVVMHGMRLQINTMMMERNFQTVNHDEIQRLRAPDLSLSSFGFARQYPTSNPHSGTKL